MQIRKLKIDDHRCLVDFNIDFNINLDGGSSTILIGENGTGKSTMLQSVLEILTSFDSDAVAKKINYQYEFEYYYKGSIINIQYSEKKYVFQVDGELFCEGTLDTVKKHLEKSDKSIFPERVSYFYSGHNNLILYPIRRVESNYNQKCKKQLVKYWNALYLQNHTYEGVFPKRKYNYCTDRLVPVYLLSILCGRDSYEKRLLIEQCHLSAIETVSILLNVENVRLSNNIIEIGNEGVCDLISFIDDRFTELFRQGFLYQDGEHFIYEINNIDSVEADSITFFNFFEKIENLLGAELEISVKFGNSSVISGYLSEGQRQFIKVLGMLGVCKSEDALVLMDEPDSHMNPKWRYDLRDIIEKCLSDGEVTNTQAIIATHDPLVINGVPKEYVRIFMHNQAVVSNNGYYFTKVITPTEDTEGLGIDGLLQSEYYGLPSILDAETKKKMDKKHALLVKKKYDTINEEETQKLIELTIELENMSFARNIPTDSYYDEYVAAMHKIYSERPKTKLTADDIEERNAKAEEILRGLLVK